MKELTDIPDLKETLNQKYVIEKKSMRKVAREINQSLYSLTLLFKFYGIKPRPKRKECIKGQKFGKWTVVRDAGVKITGEIYVNGKKKFQRARIFLCKCECGVRKEVYAINLYNGESKQCMKCSYVKMRKPYNKLSRERIRQLRREREGLCKRKCDERLFRSGFCEEHYNQWLERSREMYQAKKHTKKNINKTYIK